MKRTISFLIVSILGLFLVQSASAALELASGLSIPTDIEYKEAFTVSASVKSSGSNFSGKIGLALLDADQQLVTILDARSVTITSGATQAYTFAVPSWSELFVGKYYASIQYLNTSNEWIAIFQGNYNNLAPLNIGVEDVCSESTLIYECQFEQDLLNWTFANAPGINSGFAVGSAATPKKDTKALFVSPDGGITAGYTQDSDDGYVSVAYKKIYLEPGSYDLYQYIYANLYYRNSDIETDKDYLRATLIPASNTITPTDYYDDNYPSFVTQYLFRDYWYNDSFYEQSNSFQVTKAGSYYLTYMFCANKNRVNGNTSIDNIRIVKRHPISLDLTMTETTEGCLFTWKQGYSEYNIEWYTSCNSNKKRATLTTTSYLVPYTQLRDIVANHSYIYFTVKAKCSENKIISDNDYYTLNTWPFPKDTCPALPKLNYKATEYGVEISWSGNSGTYDIKYGGDSYGCNWTKLIESTQDTTYFISYNPSEYYTGSYYFFVRGICANDTSLWVRVMLKPSYPHASSSTVCHATPHQLYAQNISEGIHLTWMGNAPRYEVQCQSEEQFYNSGTSQTHTFIANGSELTIPYGTLTDTLYHFRVRALCENDTSQWTDHISAYNINFGDYCIPFFDLCGPNTVCTYGKYSNPYSNTRTFDFRQKDWAKSYYHSKDGYRKGIYSYDYYRSRHTICFEGETDPHCDNELSTVPPGEKYSMRLGNWYNGEGESVTFTHKIDSGYKLILLLKYAVVLQDPSHTSAENPHFTLEILDENNVALDQTCWYADFAADKSAEGWINAVNAHEPNNDEFRNVVWKDWTTIGVNLSDLALDGDRIIKIRLTTKDCTRGEHYGYAYFTLQCTDGDMQGMACGVRPEEFRVAEGFNYNWYLMDDPTKTTVCDSNVFVIHPSDTNSYYVDMISLENEECYYTLKAYTLPRLPRPQAQFIYNPHDCINEVKILNSSYVYKIMPDNSEQPDGRIPIESVFWDFGEYGTSTAIDPTLIVRNEGDTFNVTLQVVANSCVETQEYTLEIPSIFRPDGYTRRYMCKGQTFRYQDLTITEPGTYILAEVTNSVGCDSTSYLIVEYMPEETIQLYDTICFGLLPYDFYGQSCTESGTYRHTVKSKSGCDSIHYVLDLVAYQKLAAELDPVSEICSGDPSFDMTYKTLSDTSLEFVITFSEKAKQAGFVDTIGYTDTQGRFSINLPKDVRPDTYSATISLDNHGCEQVTLELQFLVLYSSDIIAQRWNDFLGIHNEHYNGGYVFTNYQWYLNDQPIQDHVAAQIYTPGQLLDFEGEYRVLLTRKDDGTSIMSCPFTPTYFNEEDCIQICTFTRRGQTIQAKVSQEATMYMYHTSGLYAFEFSLQEGENHINMPQQEGVYISKVIYSNGNTEVFKIILH